MITRAASLAIIDSDFSMADVQGYAQAIFDSIRNIDLYYRVCTIHCTAHLYRQIYARFVIISCFRQEGPINIRHHTRVVAHVPCLLIHIFVEEI